MKKYKRKNPETTIDLLLCDFNKAINDGNAYALTDAITYYKQGEKCKDCEKRYYQCECEKCPDCEYNRCLCNLGFTKTDYDNACINNDPKIVIYENRVKKLAIKLAKEILTKNQLKELEVS